MQSQFESNDWNVSVAVSQELLEESRSIIREAASQRVRRVKAVEIRAKIPSGVFIAYADNEVSLAEITISLNNHRADFVAWTHNEIRTDRLDIARNRAIRSRIGQSTTDADITEIKFLCFDLDPAVKSSSFPDDQLAAEIAHSGDQIVSFLQSIGFPSPSFKVLSGNGLHLFYDAHITNDESTKPEIAELYRLLRLKFGNPRVKIDTTVCNPSRVMRAPGTFNWKGVSDSHPEPKIARPVYLPNQGRRIEQSNVRRAIALLKQDLRVVILDSKRPVHLDDSWKGNGDYRTLDAIAWFKSHDLFLKMIDGTRVAVSCPFADQHSQAPREHDTSSILFVGNDQSWPGFFCAHNACGGRNIKDVMTALGDADDFCSRRFVADIGRDGKALLSQQSLSDQFVARYRTEIRYFENRFWRWRSGVWRTIADREVMQLMQETAQWALSPQR